MDADINHRWTQLREMYGEVEEACVGREKKSRPAPLMSQQMWKLINSRRRFTRGLLELDQEEWLLDLRMNTRG